jgi:UDP-N-acetylglucosamine:LPS N-acetylglucosamine transferase
MRGLAETRRRHLLVALGDGGHTAEIVRLVELLGPVYDYSYVVAHNDQISESKLPYPGQVWRLTRPRAKDEALASTLWHLGRSLVEAARIVGRCRPDALVGSGPAMLVPLAVLGKLWGAEIIFVETGSRISELSLTGKIMLRLADLFFVQWEPLHQRYPRSIYAGRLL